MTTFKALRIDKTDAGTKAAFVDFDEKDLMPGNVTVRVSHSTVNYKDGLAITGKNPRRSGLADDRRHRFRRHGGDVGRSRIQAG